MSTIQGALAYTQTHALHSADHVEECMPEWTDGTVLRRLGLQRRSNEDPPESEGKCHTQGHVSGNQPQ
jgi:hypothetical protein